MSLTALKTFLAKILALALGTFAIRFDYDKAKAHPEGHGYDRHPDTPYTGILLHSTEGKKGSSFKGECTFIRDAADRSAHYEIGKDGVIQRILDPVWRAWHAGVSSWRGRADCNDYMIGVELHHTDGEEYTPAQLAALAWLCRELMHDHPTITVAGVALHRWVALPAGRKKDPTNLEDAFWQEWIADLVDDFPIEARPSITRDVFAAQLQRRKSPALVEHADGGYYFDVVAGYGLDPAIALAFFGKESEFGSYEHSQVDKLAMIGARNWGNLRPVDGDPNHWAGGRAGRRVDSRRYGYFRGYERWEDGLRDWCEKMLSEQYRRKSLLAVLGIYAPATDGNDPASYAATIKAWVAGWRQQSGATVA